MNQPISSVSPGPTATPRAQPRRARGGTVMTGWLATLIAVLTTLVGLIVLAWAILFITKGRFLKHPFERIVGSYANREVKVAGDFQLYFDPIDLKFLAEGMTVSNPAWASRPNVYEGKLIETRLRTFASIFGKKRLDFLNLQDSRIDLEWNRDHTRNTWTFSDDPTPLELPIITRAEVAGTRIRYRDQKMQIAADIAIDTVRATGTRIDNAIRFSGGGTARRIPFTLAGALLSPNSTIGGGETRLDVTLNAVRTRARVWGMLPGATVLEGSRLNADVRGRNLNDVFRVAGIAVPDTRAYHIRSALTKAGNEWRFTRLAGEYGASDISGWFTVAMIEPRMKVTGSLLTRRLAVVDLAPFLGYDPDAVATKGAQAAVPQTGGTPRLLPNSPLNVDALSNFDANVKYAVRDIAGRNIPISNAEVTVGLDNRLLTLSPFTFDMARGHVDADISINARVPRIVTDYDVRLSPTPMGVLLAGWGVEESGTSGTIKGRVKMRGFGNNVRDSLASSDGRIAVILPKGTFWTRNVQLAELDVGTFVQKLLQKKLKKPVLINCGLVGFTVRNGIAAADPILIDTDQNVITGRGGFSFRNEAIDLAFKADAKKFSLFSAQSPLGLNGYFAAPGYSIVSSQLLTRAGAGLGLSLFASPLAGVLAFVDFGNAKAAACGPVLSGATAAAQRTVKGDVRKDVGKGTTKIDAQPAKKKKFLGIF